MSVLKWDRQFVKVSSAMRSATFDNFWAKKVNIDEDLDKKIYDTSKSTETKFSNLPCDKKITIQI